MTESNIAPFVDNARAAPGRGPRRQNNREDFYMNKILQGVTQKNETYLPLFSGFYGSIWELDLHYIDEEISQARQDKGLFSDYNVDDLKIDYESFENDVVQNFAQALQENLSEYNLIKSIDVQKIVHPAAYNFKNDSVDVAIEFYQENLSDFIYSRHESFCAYLKSRYTSRDGFISWYSNDFETWQSDTKHFSDFSKNGHILGAILDFVCQELKIEEFSLYESVMENIYPINYAENLDDIINQSDNSLFELLTSNGIESGFAGYIENSFNNGVLSELSLSENILSIVWQFENREAVV